MTVEPAAGAVGDWRVLPVEIDEPQSLLERGLVLLEGLMDEPRPVLRWYRSTRTALVLGRGQRLPANAPADAAGVEIISRHSGGGAVLLDPSLLSLDVIVPPHHPLAAGDLTDAFDRVGEAWQRALTSLGVPGLEVHTGPATARRRGSERERLLAAVCYATLSHGEVTSAGRKVVGLAQRRRRHGALVQCGLLRRWQPAPLLTALGAEPNDPEIAHAAVGLEDLGCGHISDQAVMVAVSAELGAGYPRRGNHPRPSREAVA